MEERAELVKNMLNEGLLVDEVSKYTRFARKDVEAFRIRVLSNQTKPPLVGH